MDRLLNIFITVVEEKNLTRAGEKLFITQSAISQNLKILERKFNAQLLNRTNKQISLTKPGEILYFHARQIINQYTLTERLIYELQEGISGPLNIGSGFTFGEYLLPDLISKFITKHPKIRPKITIKNSIRIANQVRENDLDIGIIEREVTDDLLQTTPFAEDDMVVIVPTNFINHNEADIRYLSDKTWIIRENGSGTRQVTDNMFNNTGINPKNILEFGSTQIIKEAVRKGLGVSYISKLAVQSELKKGTIKSFPLENYKDTRKFYYVINKSRPSTKILEMFIDTIDFKF
ncbi:LysR family transcriptional regulator [Rossellomorea aquimaris]|uniref:DNA-binding transcriptional LysR family regulator n=1 Tax=Rossellomorea aquimaris TaxID=189382 RepID=A0A366EKM0_9BACI|nr:LysR family transcriptional regulator [Rossellomorea aquimaris]RBP02506.1 DNA-binding transcriptional LysR family regulator [Rossellomorea aquimaris]